jgi:hypothetical protein
MYGHSGDIAAILTAYTDGRLARRNGMPRSANPYPATATGTVTSTTVRLRDRWDDGWDREPPPADRTGL